MMVIGKRIKNKEKVLYHLNIFIGIFTYFDGTKYRGEFKNDLKEGKGKLTFINGDCYEGLFESRNNTLFILDIGKLRFNNYREITGGWKDFKFILKFSEDLTKLITISRDILEVWGSAPEEKRNGIISKVLIRIIYK